MTATQQAVTSPAGSNLWKLARAGWYVCAAVAWGILILSGLAQTRSLAAQASSDAAFSARVAVELVAPATASLISLLLAGVLYFKRPNERLVLLTSYFLLANGMVITPLTFLEPYWPGAQGLTYQVFQPLFFAPLLIAFLSVFPNGRFTPAWTRWLVVAAVLYAPVGTLQFTAQAYSRPTPAFVFAVLVWFGLIFAGLYAQVHRFRRVSNFVERQQTKWCLYGFAGAAILALLLSILTIGLNYFSPFEALPWWASFVELGWVLVFGAFPVALSFAVLRFRLFDIDLIINRTLVYGTLTAVVLLVYALTVGSLSLIFQSRGSLLFGLLTTGLIAILFQPLRERLQRAVNRLIYGEREDPVEALSRMGRHVEAALPPDQILPALVETIAHTLKLPYVAIHSPSDSEDQVIASFGRPSPDVVGLPLVYHGRPTGRLVVGLRSTGSQFSPTEMRLLRNIARQAGSAVHSRQLTRDLRLSRARIVAAREEERRRLRRDLHDGLGPVLASQGLKIAAVSRLVDEDPDKARQLLEELMDQNAETVSEIRRLVYELRPAALDDLGLVGAIRDFASALGVGTNESPHLQVEVLAPARGLSPLPAAIEAAAYRIATEAITNVVRHARAGHVSVALAQASASGNPALRLEITDDGIGLPGNVRSGVGLISMRERAEEVGGDLLIESSPGKGTRVAAEFPLPED